MKIRQLGMIAAVGLAMLAAPLTANANGYSENGSWQFRSANDLIAKLIQVDVMEKKESGYYGPANVTVNSYNDIDIDSINYDIETQNNVSSCGNCINIDGDNNTLNTTQTNNDSPTTAAGTVNVDDIILNGNPN